MHHFNSLLSMNRKSRREDIASEGLRKLNAGQTQLRSLRLGRSWIESRINLLEMRTMGNGEKNDQEEEEEEEGCIIGLDSF
jgi:hypothetical protein